MPSSDPSSDARARLAAAGAACEPAAAARAADSRAGRDVGGDGRKVDVRLVVEVLGRSLQFEERGGRFNERIELALLTVERQRYGIERHDDRHRSAVDARRPGAGQGHRRALAVGARIAAGPPSAAGRGTGRAAPASPG